MRVTLECSQKAFEGLWDALHKARRSAKTVTVDRAALGAMLRDHGRVLAETEPRVTITNPYSPATLARAAQP